MTKARDLANSAAAFASVSATELGYVDGVTSAIQTQIDGKQAVNANVSTTELGYLDGVTSAIQTQLDAKTAKATLTTTGDIYYASAANTPARLGIGTTGQVVTVASGIPSWATPSANGTWATWSPTWGNFTIGNGTNTARYVQNGNVVFFTLTLTLGTTSSMGNGPYVSWPVAPSSTAAAKNAAVNAYVSSAAGPLWASLNPTSRSTTILPVSLALVSGTTITADSNITSTAPFTWNTGCLIFIQGSYEVA